GAWMQVVYLPGKPAPPSKTRKIAAEIALRLAAVETAFLEGRKRLKVVEGPDGQPAYLTQELEDLLEKTERDLLAILHAFPELEALAGPVCDQFRAARIGMGPGSQEAARIAFASLQTRAGGLRLAQAGRATVAVSRGDARLDRAERNLGFLQQRAQLGDFEGEH